MPKYRVAMKEYVFYSVYIEAEDEDQAAAKAESQFLAGHYHVDGVDDRSIVEIEEES